MGNTNIGIFGVGAYLPPEVRANDWWPREIVARWQERRRRYFPEAQREAGPSGLFTEMAAYDDDPFQGAQQRRVMDATMRSSDMEAQAARTAIERAGVDPREIGFVLSSSLVPDHLTTNQAAIIHRKVGGLRPSCLTLAADSVCSSFLHQLILAEGLLSAGEARYGLLVQSAACSRILPREEPFSPMLGDAATAVVVGKTSTGRGLRSHETFVDGTYCDGFICGVPDKSWYEEGNIVAYAPNPKRTREMMIQCCEQAPGVMNAALAKAQLTTQDVGFFSSHQPTAWAGPTIKKLLGLSAARSIDTFRWTASVVACSIPMQLSVAEAEGILQPGSVIACYSFAVGMTAAAAVLTWGR